jgi:predicted lipoprotein with Yx(FWY)xxD motif
MKKRLLLITALGALAVGAGGAASAPTTSTEAAATQARATLTARSSAFGRILFDGRGYALYAFTSDPRGRSACSGACAEAWPPYIVSGRLRAGAGVKKSLLGTIRRPDGSRQLTYAGHPLYYYVGDRRAGEVRCQNVFEFGGLWLVVRPSGRLVR